MHNSTNLSGSYSILPVFIFQSINEFQPFLLLLRKENDYNKRATRSRELINTSVQLNQVEPRRAGVLFATRRLPKLGCVARFSTRLDCSLYLGL